MYIAHKYGHDEVKIYLERISSFVDVLDLKGCIVVNMLSSEWKDYEDATQNQTAVIAEADCIVTRNKKDFKGSSIPAYTVTEWLNIDL